MKLQRTGHVVQMEKAINEYRIFVGKSLGM
jgi:hypothetical protein